jgi:Lysylphosphatidylglycerol synthase TM region
MWDGVAHVAPAWLALGVALHLLNQIARARGWHAVVHAATPGTGARRRDVTAAWVAGAGAGGLLSARGGDALRVFLLGRRLPDAPWSLLAGTLVAEGAGEMLLGVGLLAVAAGLGAGPRLGAPDPLVLAGVAALAVAALLAGRRRRVRALACRVVRGCALLGAPRCYARRVVPWQLASRACRLAALACFLIAFGLPATPAAVLLVTFAQTGGRLIPFGPAAVGAGVAVLAATFEPVTGTAVPFDRVAAFFLGTSTVLTLVGTVLSVVICLRAARWRELAAAVQASASAGRIAAAWRGRRLARATASPRA